MSRLKVLELAVGVMGPFAGKILADGGADVVRVEGPIGDWTKGGTPALKHGGLYSTLNNAKRIVTTGEDAGTFVSLVEKLAEHADVAIVDDISSRALTDQRLIARNPRLIRTYVSTFGHSGPYFDYAASCFQLLALGGMMYITGDPGREPLQIPGHHPEFIGGLHAYTATMAAVLRRQRFPKAGGERVEVTAFEAVASSAEMATTMYSYTGAVRSRFSGRQPWGIQGEVLPCKDGYIAVHPGSMETLAFLIGRPDLAEDPLFTDGIYRLRHADRFLDLLRPYLLERNRTEILEECEALRIPFGGVFGIADLVEDPQLHERGYFRQVETDGEKVLVPGPVYTIAGREYPKAAQPAADAQSVVDEWRSAGDQAANGVRV